MMKEGFLRPAFREMLIGSKSADELLRLILESKEIVITSGISENQI
jgi:hypothetical protein